MLLTIRRKNKMKILLVDDAKEVRDFISRFLVQWGYDVEIADNGYDALQKIRQLNIQLVISDWVMPEMDGIQLCKELRTSDLGRYTYLIVLTGKTKHDDMITGFTAGADDFISKPVNTEVLKARINSAIRIIDMENKLARMNKLLKRQNEEIKAAYVQLDENLQEAKRMLGDTEVVVLTTQNTDQVAYIR